jgi:hypothetical protein
LTLVRNSLFIWRAIKNHSVAVSINHVERTLGCCANCSTALLTYGLSLKLLFFY